MSWNIRLEHNFASRNANSPGRVSGGLLAGPLGVFGVPEGTERRCQGVPRSVQQASWSAWEFIGDASGTPFEALGVIGGSSGVLGSSEIV